MCFVDQPDKYGEFSGRKCLTVVLTSPYVFSILSIILRNKAPYGFKEVHFG